MARTLATTRTVASSRTLASRSVLPALNVPHFARASTQRLAVNTDTNLNIGVGVSYSLGCWASLDDLTTEQAFIGKSLTTGNQRGYILEYQQTTGHYRYIASADGVNTINVVTNATPLASVLHHVLLTWDASTSGWVFYVDGASSNSGTANLNVFSNTASGFIGAYQTGTFANMNGLIAAAGLWKRALSATEVLQLYNGGKALRYAGLAAGLKTSLAAYWNLISADYNDYSGNGEHLKQLGGVTQVNGITFSRDLS